MRTLFPYTTLFRSLAADILEANPDFVTLQEVSVANERLLEHLKDAYPHQHLCWFNDRSGIAVLSRTPPMQAGRCSRRFGMARILVDLPTGPHYVAAVHLSWPFPGAQPRQLKRLIADLEARDQPIIIGGDFNMVPWSNALSNVARASETDRAGPARTTFILGSIPIAIDHVFAPGGGTAEKRPLLGGDHFGVLARVHGAKGENMK